MHNFPMIKCINHWIIQDFVDAFIIKCFYKQKILIRKFSMHQKFNNRLGKNKIKTSAISISEVPFGIFCHLV